MIKSFEEIFIKELTSLKTEINSFKRDEDLWVIKGEIKNTAGNLALHLCGNLQHFVGAWLGKTGYIRQRENEFTDTGISREKISQMIDETIVTVKKTLNNIGSGSLDILCENQFAGRDVTIGELLLILISHFSYHLGQINYLRRMIA